MGLKGKGRSMNSDGDAELCSLLHSAPKALERLTEKLDNGLELVPATLEAV